MFLTKFKCEWAFSGEFLQNICLPPSFSLWGCVYGDFMCQTTTISPLLFVLHLCILVLPRFIKAAHFILSSSHLYLQVYVYRDPACYTYNLNHAVVVVGYVLEGNDPRAPGFPPPYWIIRNSWGQDWGEGGYMRMAMQGGDGVCGINTLPALVPVIKSE